MRVADDYVKLLTAYQPNNKGIRRGSFEHRIMKDVTNSIHVQMRDLDKSCSGSVNQVKRFLRVRINLLNGRIPKVYMNYAAAGADKSSDLRFWL